MTNFYHVGGTLPLDNNSYIKRQADHQLYDALKNAQFCYVLNSRQMGKSSLWIRTQQKLETENIRCAYIYLTPLTTNSSEEGWYRFLFYELVKSFNLSINNLRKRKAWWDERQDISPINCLTQFLEEVLLEEIKEPIVICLDEIDSVLSLNFSTDAFFAWIRACYNQRAKKKIYQRLTFCVLGVATVSNFIHDKNRTPFNIGKDITLSEFSKSEALPLVEGLKGKVSSPERILEEILDWTGGQPFLTQKLCKLIVESGSGLFIDKSQNAIKINFTDFVYSKIINNWESQDEPQHLRTIRDRLLFNSSSLMGQRILKLYQEILKNGDIAYDISNAQMQLRLTGLVFQEHQKLKVYNKIYRQVFDETWVKKELEKIPLFLEQYESWLESGQDTSKLLSGQDLQKALQWQWRMQQPIDQSKTSFINLSKIQEKKKRRREAEKICRNILSSKFSENDKNKLIKEILSWTNNQLELTKIICLTLIKSPYPLQEKTIENFIEYIIEKHIINNWKNGSAADHLKVIQSRILDSHYAISRLKTYRDILRYKITVDTNPEKLALLQAELIIEDNSFLYVANQVYRKVFNIDWINQEFKKRNFENSVKQSIIIFINFWINDSWISKLDIRLLVTMLFINVIFLGWGFVIIKRQLVAIKTPSSIAETLKLCQKRDPSNSLESDLNKLKSFKTKNSDKFSERCETQLKELKLIHTAIQTASNTYITDHPNGKSKSAFYLLCSIPTNSKNLDEAKYWANRWYKNKIWKLEINKVTKENSKCQKLIQDISH